MEINSHCGLFATADTIQRTGDFFNTMKTTKNIIEKCSDEFAYVFLMEREITHPIDQQQSKINDIINRFGI
jgi:hypothetical protein